MSFKLFKFQSKLFLLKILALRMIRYYENNTLSTLLIIYFSLSRNFFGHFVLDALSIPRQLCQHKTFLQNVKSFFGIFKCKVCLNFICKIEKEGNLPSNDEIVPKRWIAYQMRGKDCTTRMYSGISVKIDSYSCQLNLFV